MNKNKVYWASRRGMLELDLVLIPFAEKHYSQLDAADQRRYRRLLEQEDQDLFAWFLGRQEPSDPDLKIMVERIRAHAGANSV